MTTSAAPAVELTHLTKRFGSVTAVDDVSLTIGQGEMVALLGPNGAGKSTTTELILGIQRPDDGRVGVLGGDPVTAMRRGLVGAMLQNGVLLEETSVLTLLRLMAGLHHHPLPLDEVIARADIADILRARTGKLSGGQAQRVRFALALLPDPQLMLLDEPTVAMDVDARRRFWAGMRSFAQSGRTVVFATHYLDEADQYADRVVMLAHGRIVADGTGADIKRLVGGRRLSFVSAADVDWSALPGVQDAAPDAGRIVLTSTDSDATVRALLQAAPDVADLEITGARLEDAFLQITA